MVHREFGSADNRRRVWCGFLAKDRPSDDVIDADPPNLTMVWLLRGGGIYRDGDSERRIEAGDLVIRRPGRRHSTLADGDGQWVEFFVVIDPCLARALLETGVLPADMRVLHPGVDLSLVSSCEAFMREVERAAPDALGDLLARSHALVAEFLTLDRRRRQGDSRSMAIEQARRLLDEEFDTAIPEIAHRVGLRYEAFRKAFAELVGEAPHAYRLRRRIEVARALLLQDRSPVAEVATQVGFTDVFHFSKKFRQIVGEPPARWRRRHLGQQ
jgi:AraC-like DNA-binding protein